MASSWTVQYVFLKFHVSSNNLSHGVSSLLNTYEDSPRQETKISSALKKRIHRKSANKKHR